MATIVHIAEIALVESSNISAVIVPLKRGMVEFLLSREFWMVSETILDNKNARTIDKLNMINTGKFSDTYIIKYGPDQQLFRCWINYIGIVQTPSAVVVHLSKSEDVSKLAEAVAYVLNEG